MDGSPDSDVRQTGIDAGPRSRVRILGGERGYTLVEMLLAAVLAMVVIGGPLTFMIFSFNQQNATSSRTNAARQAEVGLERLTRDLREAQQITNTAGTNTTPVTVTYGAGSSSATFNVPTPGSQAAGPSVVWTCTAGGSCTRQQGGGAAIPLIRGVTSAAFTPIATDGTTLASGSTNPVFVSVQIKVQVTSQSDSGQTHTVATLNPITVEDGVGLRNYS